MERENLGSDEETLRIVSGSLRGRRIPFNNKRYGNARVTSDFVKEAAFATLGPALEGKLFLDLFAGSGQMGLEAWSRGADVVMNERDGRRYAFVKNLIDEWNITERVRLSRQNGFAFLSSPPFESAVDVAYLDPPYHEQSRGVPLAVAALEALVASPLCVSHTRILVQHHGSLVLPTSHEGFTQTRSKAYGETTLTTFTAE